MNAFKNHSQILNERMLDGLNSLLVLYKESRLSIKPQDIDPDSAKVAVHIKRVLSGLLEEFEP